MFGLHRKITLGIGLAGITLAGPLLQSSTLAILDGSSNTPEWHDAFDEAVGASRHHRKKKSKATKRVNRHIKKRGGKRRLGLTRYRPRRFIANTTGGIRKPQVAPPVVPPALKPEELLQMLLMQQMVQPTNFGNFNNGGGGDIFQSTTKSQKKSTSSKKSKSSSNNGQGGLQVIIELPHKRKQPSESAKTESKPQQDTKQQTDLKANDTTHVSLNKKTKPESQQDTKQQTDPKANDITHVSPNKETKPDTNKVDDGNQSRKIHGTQEPKTQLLPKKDGKGSKIDAQELAPDQKSHSKPKPRPTSARPEGSEKTLEQPINHESPSLSARKRKSAPAEYGGKRPKQSIAENAESTAENAESIKGNSERSKENAESTAENAESIKGNSERSKENAESTAKENAEDTAKSVQDTQKDTEKTDNVKIADNANSVVQGPAPTYISSMKDVVLKQPQTVQTNLLVESGPPPAEEEEARQNAIGNVTEESLLLKAINDGRKKLRKTSSETVDNVSATNTIGESAVQSAATIGIKKPLVESSCTDLPSTTHGPNASGLTNEVIKDSQTSSGSTSSHTNGSTSGSTSPHETNGPTGTETTVHGDRVRHATTCSAVSVAQEPECRSGESSPAEGLKELRSQAAISKTLSLKQNPESES